MLQPSADESAPLVLHRARPARTRALDELDNKLLQGLSEVDIRAVTAPGQVMPTTKALKFGIGTGAAALAIEPLFSWFLWGTTNEAYQAIVKDFTPLQLTPGIKAALYWTAGFFALCNLLTDFQSISFARDVENIFKEHLKTDANGENQKGLYQKIIAYFFRGNTRSEKVKTFLVHTLMLSSIPGFIQGALADNIPLSLAIFDHIASDPVSWSLVIGLGVIIGYLGTSYYYIFNHPKTVKHVDVAVDTAVDHKMDLLIAIKNNPAVYTEIATEMASNAIFRGVNFGYLTGQEAQFILRLSAAAANSPGIRTLAIGTAIQTGVITAFTRTLPTRDAFLNEKFNQLTNAELDVVSPYPLQAKAILRDFIPDMSVSLLRGLGIGLLVGDFFTSVPLGLGLGYTSGFLATANSFHVRLELNRKKHALELYDKNKKIEEERKAEADLESGVVPAVPVPPVPKLSQEQIWQRRHERATHLYDAISNMIAINVFFVIFGFFVNLGARFGARWPSFYTFAKTFLSWLTNAQNAGLTLSAGAQVMFNDTRTFDNSIREVHQNTATSYKLLTREDEVNPARTYVGMFQQTRPVRVVRAVFRARPGAHHMEILEDVYNEMKAQGRGEENKHGEVELRRHIVPAPELAAQSQSDSSLNSPYSAL